MFLTQCCRDFHSLQDMLSLDKFTKRPRRQKKTSVEEASTSSFSECGNLISGNFNNFLV
jgi:hypothetical protein